MSRYIKTPAYPDRMPVDISFVFADEKPAGKHGFCKANGDAFSFADGTLARFWGVNFNGGANFPEHDYAEKVARRLAQAGCNLVRFHQLDAEWDTPNIYSYTKGPRVKTSRELDPVSLDHLDYLIYCLKEQGIYVYFDMMTYRRFKSGDDVPYANLLGDSAKPYSIFDRRMIELQKEFADQIWNRVNKYTGLAYKDDPVIAMVEITNECDLFLEFPAEKGDNVPYYTEEFKQLFKAWVEKKGVDYDWETYSMYDPSETMVNFKIELTESYYQEMADHLRAIGVKVPITGTNWTHKHPDNVISQEHMDFLDDHHYFYDWRWGETEKCCGNAQIVEAKAPMKGPTYMRVNNRPYFISEWDIPWPNCYRAEGPIYYAAIAALQNWGGLAIHTYAYGTDLDKNSILGKEISSDTIGGIAYREGVFTTWNDPAKFGLFQHSALIFRRGDVSPANTKIGMNVTNRQKLALKFAGTGILDVHRVATILPGEEPVGCEECYNDTDATPVWTDDPNVLQSDTGELRKNMKKKIAFIDTPRTKAVYGKLNAAKFSAGSGDAMATSGLAVQGKTDFGVIVLSSLTDDPTEKSDNMLLSTIGRARNTDAQFDGDKMIETGRAPILSEVIQAKITIKTERTDLAVWGVNAEGYYVGKRPAKFEDGWMTFEVGNEFPASYYLIVAE
ncbi:MAG: hypothetical protein IJS31_06210 [Oscillospiraceae bacterium]|nr:hypothetical protein [Oscillospiraceae bacterium]